MGPGRVTGVAPESDHDARFRRLSPRHGYAFRVSIMRAIAPIFHKDQPTAAFFQT